MTTILAQKYGKTPVFSKEGHSQTNKSSQWFGIFLDNFPSDSLFFKPFRYAAWAKAIWRMFPRFATHSSPCSATFWPLSRLSNTLVFPVWILIFIICFRESGTDIATLALLSICNFYKAEFCWTFYCIKGVRRRVRNKTELKKVTGCDVRKVISWIQAPAGSWCSRVKQDGFSFLRYLLSIF